MGQADGQQREASSIGYLIVAFRVPIGTVGSVVVTLFFASWLLLETAVALMAFPLAALFANQAWVRASWLGRFPIALREFSRDEFKYLRRIWRWVGDPKEMVEFDVELPGSESQSPAPDAAVLVDQTGVVQKPAVNQNSGKAKRNVVLYCLTMVIPGAFVAGSIVEGSIGGMVCSGLIFIFLLTPLFLWWSGEMTWG